MFNNADLEGDVFCSMFKEFMICAEFCHPGIVNNKFYFWKVANNGD